MAAAPLSLLRLVELVGSENIAVQSLLESVTNIRRKSDRSVVVSFVTDEDRLNPDAFVAGKERYLGLILWLPRERVESVRRQHASATPKEDL